MLNRDSDIVICSRFVNCDLVIYELNPAVKMQLLSFAHKTCCCTIYQSIKNCCEVKHLVNWHHFNADPVYVRENFSPPIKLGSCCTALLLSSNHNGSHQAAKGQNWNSFGRELCELCAYLHSPSRPYLSSVILVVCHFMNLGVLQIANTFSNQQVLSKSQLIYDLKLQQISQLSV